MWSAAVEIRAEHGHMMPLLQPATQLERVELRPRLVPRQEVVNGVEHVETRRGHS